MSVSLKLAGQPLLLYHHHPFKRFHEFSVVSIHRVSGRYWLHKSNNSSVSLRRSPRPRVCSIGGDDTDYGTSNASNCEGSTEKNETGRGGPLTSNDILKRLKRYGISGILSYGLLNTTYYLTTFLIVWFHIAPAPGRMGYLAAVERFLKIMAMVWAGSQVTKLIRAGGALALAPFVDRGLSWFTDKFKFESQGKAFMVIVGFCFGLAIMLFLGVTMLWA
ncbi:hypothetical protein I3843_13G016200 [Carya illinoinensis]|uniref:Uncharacterized protein n=1 Tax=Carya illinoinensis TaxID=32201 RepID=A0A8T1NNT8_CARIL|nr:uncharacterized protein LOC122292330 isoform X3 [Carya illinoinensis]KAG6630440.1 hypothetical protein CIPAW_13G018000 [Carya illinoinensis]KAG7948612.1 hypothetical protein I3843_13G016200 [Carya illinoinensis]